MIKFKYLKFKKAGTFSSVVSVPLENIGCVFLGGDNQDTGGSNGAGKSTIFEVLQHVLFSSTSKGFSRNKFGGDGYRAQVGLEVDGHEYEITQFRGAKNQERKDGFIIKKDGVDVTPKGTRHMQDCINYIKSFIGITESEFGGYVYLAQEGAGHILISGKGAEKRSYLSDLFTLDRYDAVKEGVEAELETINAKMIALQEKVAIRDELQGQLDDITVDPNAFEQMSKSLEATREFIVVKKKEWAEKLRGADALRLQEQERLRVEAQLSSIFPGWDKLDVADAIKKRQLKLRNVSVRVEKLSRLAELLEEKTELQSKYIKSIEISEEDAMSALSDAQSAVALLSEEIRLIKRRVVLEEQLPDISNISGDLLERLKGTEESLVRMKLQLKEAKELLRKCENLTGVECPTCGQDLDTDAILKRKEKAERMIRTLKPAIDNDTRIVQELEKLSEKAREYDKIKAQIAELPTGLLSALNSKYASMEKEITRLKSISTKARENTITAKRLGEITNKLAEYESTSIDELDGLKEEEAKLDKQIAKLNKLSGLKAHFDTLPVVEALSTEEFDKISELAKYYDTAEIQLASMISEAAVAQKSHETLSTRLQDVSVQLEEWEPTQKRKALFEAMRGAYGPKGLKVLQLKKVCAAICKTLPKYTSLMFQEPRIEFFVDEEPDSVEIELYIRRFLKEGIEEYPVGKLSGGEKKRLAVALIFALADLVAPRKRCNLIILDEVGDGLDDMGEYAFSSQLLPQLSQESIIITSHRPGIKAAKFKKQWLVSKKDNRSTLAV